MAPKKSKAAASRGPVYDSSDSGEDEPIVVARPGGWGSPPGDSDEEEPSVPVEPHASSSNDHQGEADSAAFSTGNARSDNAVEVEPLVSPQPGPPTQAPPALPTLSPLATVLEPPQPPAVVTPAPAVAIPVPINAPLPDNLGSPGPSGITPSASTSTGTIAETAVSSPVIPRIGGTAMTGVTAMQKVRQSLGLRKGEPLPQEYFIQSRLRESLGLDEDDPLPPGYSAESGILVESSPAPSQGPAVARFGNDNTDPGAPLEDTHVASSPPTASVHGPASTPARMPPSGNFHAGENIDDDESSSGLDEDMVDAGEAISGGQSVAPSPSTDIAPVPGGSVAPSSSSEHSALAFVSILSGSGVQPASEPASAAQATASLTSSGEDSDPVTRRTSNRPLLASTDEDSSDDAPPDESEVPPIPSSSNDSAQSAASLDAEATVRYDAPASPYHASDPPESPSPPVVNAPRRSARNAGRQAAPAGAPSNGGSSDDDGSSGDDDSGSHHEPDEPSDVEDDEDVDVSEEDISDASFSARLKPEAKSQATSKSKLDRKGKSKAPLADEDVEADDEPTTRKRKPKISSVRAGTFLDAARELRDMDAKFKSVKDDFDLSENISLIQADKLRFFLKDSALLRVVAPYKRAEPARLLEDFLNEPLPPHPPAWRWRYASPTQQAKTPGGTGVSFVLGTRSNQTLVETNISYAIIAEDDPRRDEDVTAVCDSVLEILQRLPYPRFSSTFLEALIRVVAHVIHHAPKVLFMPTWQKTSGHMLVPIRHIIRESGEVAITRLEMAHGQLANVDIDDIPDVEEFCSFKAGTTFQAVTVTHETREDGSTYTSSAIPADILAGPDADNAVKLEKFMRFATYTLSDRIVSSDGLKEMFHMMLSDSGIRVHMAQGIYGGRHLFYPKPSQEERSVSYRLSDASFKDISAGEMPQHIAFVRTLDGVLASIPLDVGISYFSASGDPRIAALYLAQAADMVNEQVLEQQHGSAMCFCDKQMAFTITHHCQACLGERVCRSLIRYNNARVCKGCKVKLEGDASPDTIEKVVTKSTTRNHNRECRVFKKNPQSKEEKKRLDDMLKMVLENCRPGGKWYDDYKSQERELSGISEARVHRDPFVCSIDAVEPYALSHDDTMRVHTAENVVLTTSGYNYIKQRQLVGWLVELATYQRSSTHSPEEKREFLELAHQLYLVACKTPFTKKARTEGRGLADLLADVAEWRCGRPVTEDGPWNDLYWQWSLSGYRSQSCYWDAETIKRLSGLIDEIMQSFGVELQKADDGAPWIADEDGEPCPSWWGWGPLSVCMTQRLRRMRIICNRYWITIDSPEGLCAEFFYQLCCDDEEYREFFDLPLTIWLRHPCCFSVGHKIHGEGMATGWPTKPSKLSDRNNEANNILFETWTSNTAKMDMEEVSCDALRVDIVDVKLHRPELYNPSNDPLSVDFPKRSDQTVIDHLTAQDIAAESLVMSIEVDEDAGNEEEGEVMD
ncbi:hypothetical protein D6D04_05544 [Aureobasidium pullulans]|nr:hypothetical protein D6D04_05544 [Aureobasidium pullulans]